MSKEAVKVLVGTMLPDAMRCATRATEIMQAKKALGEEPNAAEVQMAHFYYDLVRGKQYGPSMRSQVLTLIHECKDATELIAQVTDFLARAPVGTKTRRIVRAAADKRLKELRAEALLLPGHAA